MPAMQRTMTVRIRVQAGQVIKQDPISEITRAKEIGDLANVVECLFSKHEAPSSALSTTKKMKMWLSLIPIIRSSLFPENVIYL
jgi:hypothetical protein